MSIPDFISRCDAHCKRSGLSRRRLSKLLFADTYRLENLAAGGSDVGVKRLGQAIAKLEDMEREHVAQPARGRAAA